MICNLQTNWNSLGAQRGGWGILGFWLGLIECVCFFEYSTNSLMQFLLPERVRILCHIWGIGQGMQWCLHLCSRLAWPGLVWQPQQLSWVISLCVRNGRKIKQERGGEGGAELEQEQSRQQKAAGKGKQARPRDAGQKK